MNRVDKKKVFIKGLAILAQPYTLLLPKAGIQLIAQGSIYAITDSIIGNGYDFPDIKDVINDYSECVQSAVYEIIENYNGNEFIVESSGRYYSEEERACILVEEFCKKFPNQYSEQEKNQITTALGKYLISMRICILQNPNSVRMIQDLFGNSINKLNIRIDEIERFITCLKRESQTKNSIPQYGTEETFDRTDNKKYIDSFTETLFLHRSQQFSKVNLVNLFVLQNYEILYDGYENERKRNEEGMVTQSLPEYLGETIEYTNSDKHNRSLIIIEGDAGCGKSSLVAWMNYHHSLNDEISHVLFMGRPLITIRLRDLHRNHIIENYDLLYAIRKHMNLESLDDMERFFPEAVVVLDGFDELCMIEGVVSETERLLFSLMNKGLNGYSFIITTRPKYIDMNRVDINRVIISLKHFDEMQREQWINHFTSAEYCGQSIDDEVADYILSIEDDATSCICDTPMTLYMLSSRHGMTQYLDNSWALYRHIFYESLSETEYNKMFPNADRIYSHEIERIKDIIYRISEEIAFRMYKRENKSFFVTSDEVAEIVKELGSNERKLENTAIKVIAEHCYALCCYWKANSDQGVIEFYHNNIRDFFLAEKICRKLDEFADDMMRGNEKNHKQLAFLFCEMFSYGMLQTRALEFIVLRLRFQKSHNKSCFANFEYKNKLITKMLIYLSGDGIYKSDFLSEHSVLNPTKRMNNIIASVIHIFRCIYEVQLTGTEVIPWIPVSAYQNHILLNSFKYYFCQNPITLSSDYMISFGSRGRFSGMELCDNDLRCIGFQYSEMRNMKFKNTILTGCDFSNAVLSGTDFSNADASYTSFRDTDLSFCNFTNTNLIGATLPDGYISLNQDEQLYHLRCMNFTNLKLNLTCGEFFLHLLACVVQIIDSKNRVDSEIMFVSELESYFSRHGCYYRREVPLPSLEHESIKNGRVDFLIRNDNNEALTILETKWIRYIDKELIQNYIEQMVFSSNLFGLGEVFLVIIMKGALESLKTNWNFCINYVRNMNIDKCIISEFSELRTGYDYVKHLAVKIECSVNILNLHTLFVCMCESED